MSKIIYLNPPRKAGEVDEWWVRQNWGSPVLKELLEKGEYKPPKSLTMLKVEK